MGPYGSLVLGLYGSLLLVFYGSLWVLIYRMHTCYALLTCVRDMNHRMYTYLCVYVFTCSPFARQLVTLNTLYRPKRTAMQHRLCRAMQHREHQDVRTQSHVRTAPGRDGATRMGYAAPLRMVPSAHRSIKSGLARDRVRLPLDVPALASVRSCHGKANQN